MLPGSKHPTRLPAGSATSVPKTGPGLRTPTAAALLPFSHPNSRSREAPQDQRSVWVWFPDTAAQPGLPALSPFAGRP